MNIKFKNFLNDKTEYEAAEKFWLCLFEEFNSLLDDNKKWESWFDLVWGNGEKKFDGNPIICRWNKELNFGLRVIQEDSEFENQPLIGAWMSKFDNSIDELVITCVLTDETESICRRLIRAYVVDSLPAQEMQKLIDDICNLNPS